MNGYYQIISQHIEADQACFHLRLLSDCEVYQGHFPSQPIAPGACSLEMIRQCASLAMKRDIHWNQIKQCKFLFPLDPAIHNELDLTLSWTASAINAVLMWEDKVVIKLKTNGVATA